MSAAAEDDLPMWVIYDHPTDYPDSFVARQYVVGIAGRQPTDRLIHSATLDSLRSAMLTSGFVCVTRSPEDDPVIVETWL